MMETLYDLAIRELSELTAPAKELLAEAPEEEEDAAPEADAGSPRRLSVLRTCCLVLFGPPRPAR